jgi:hypothetical protein
VLNLLNQTPQPYNGRIVWKHPGGLTEPGSRVDGFGVRVTHVQKQQIALVAELTAHTDKCTLFCVIEHNFLLKTAQHVSNLFKVHLQGQSLINSYVQ